MAIVVASLVVVPTATYGTTDDTDAFGLYPSGIILVHVVPFGTEPLIWIK